MNKMMLDFAELLANEKNVDKSIVLSALESAVAGAVKKSLFRDEDADIEVKIDPLTGDQQIWRRWLVVPDADGIQEPDRQILEWEAKEDYADQGDLKAGDYVREKIEDVDLVGRRFATDARQVILQKLREAERSQILEEFLNIYRGQKVVTGQVRKMDKGDAIVEIGRLEARLPKSDMIPHDNLRTGDRVRAYIKSIDPTARQQQVILSRTDNEFLVELLKIEVPEIDEGLLEIKKVVRVPGSRAKVAVQVKDKRIDPIGTCVGVKGSRVQSVTKELGDERIDIVKWSDQPAEFVIWALAPATVSSIIVHNDEKKMDVVVAESERGRAIGFNGQNVNLTKELTGWDINVLTIEEAQEKRKKEHDDIRENLMSKLDIGEDVAQVLIDNGIETVEEVAYLPEEDLLGIEEFDEDTVKELRQRARTASLTEDIEREEILKSTDPAIMGLDGMTNDIAAAIGKGGVKTLDDLADLATDELAEMAGIDQEEAAKIIVAAREHWNA
ncbi:MAG: transcription termination factor NusA [Burkholderiales bacterium]|nr:transcription termination factor NusA [Burkholderiales bacterium]